MKVCGFTIARNVVKFDYPVVEAIRSILPVCDEFVVGLAESEDSTPDVIQSISSPKVRAVPIDWPEEVRTGGRVLALATTQTLRHCSGDWAFYIQADEVVHEKYHDVIRQSMERYLERAEVEALTFRYVHFYGGYQYYQDNFLQWYTRAARIVRPLPEIVSWGDGCSFRYVADGTPRELRKKPSGACVYHYGWVKRPDLMTANERNLERLYHDDDYIEQKYGSDVAASAGSDAGADAGADVYEHYGHLAVFKETHPEVMKARVEAQDWTFDARIDRQRPRPIRRAWLWAMFPWVKTRQRLAER